MLDDIGPDTLLGSPLLKRLCPSIDSDVSIRPAVIGLLSLGYPPAVTGGISAIVAHPVKSHPISVSIGQGPLFKDIEGIPPLLAHGYPAAAILSIILPAGIMTAAISSPPYIIQGTFAHSGSMSHSWIS